MATTTLNLASALGLRPLDRVQINNRAEIAEMRNDQHMNGAGELPFLYFQRVLSDGRIEVRSPNGYATALDALDVCDVLHGEPVIVRAMPQSVCIARQRLPLRDRQSQPGSDSFAQAYVVYAAKDRWGRADAYVWFLDAALNTTGRPWQGPLHNDDRALLARCARRTRMPVINGTRGASYSADHGCQREEQYNRTVAKALIRAALLGSRSSVQALTSAGVKKIPLSTLNRLA